MSESSEFVSEVFPLALVVQVPNKFEFDFSSDDVEEMVHLALDFPIDSNTLNFIHETEKDDDDNIDFSIFSYNNKVQQRDQNQMIVR